MLLLLSYLASSSTNLSGPSVRVFLSYLIEHLGLNLEEVLLKQISKEHQDHAEGKFVNLVATSLHLSQNAIPHLSAQLSTQQSTISSQVIPNLNSIFARFWSKIRWWMTMGCSTELKTWQGRWTSLQYPTFILHLYMPCYLHNTQHIHSDVMSLVLPTLFTPISSDLSEFAQKTS